MADEVREAAPQQRRKPKLGYAILPRQETPDMRVNASAARWSVVASDGALLGSIFGKVGADSGYIANTTLAAGGSAALVTVGPASLLRRQPAQYGDGLPPPLTWSQVLTEIVALLEQEGWVCLSSAEQLRDIKHLDVEVETQPAAGLTKRERPVYSEERMRQALQDIGWNTSCNACMGLFYADDGPFVHSNGCPFVLDGTTIKPRSGPTKSDHSPAPSAAGDRMADEARAVTPQQMRKPKLGYAILPHKNRPDQEYESGATWIIVTPDMQLLGRILGDVGADSGYIASMSLDAGGGAALATVGSAGRMRPLTWDQVLAEVKVLLEREGWVCISDEELRDLPRHEIEPVQGEPVEAGAKPEAEPAEQGAPLYSEEHLLQGLSNIGWNTSCGACMGLFHTGYGMYPHDEGCPHAPGVVTVTLDPEPAEASRPPTLAEATSIITAWLPEASKIWSWYTGADKDVVAVTVFLPGLSAPAHWTSDQPHAVSPILLDGSHMGPGAERDAWADAWGRLYRGRANAPKHVWRWAPWTFKVDTGA